VHFPQLTRLPVTSPSPISAPSSQQHRRRPPQKPLHSRVNLKAERPRCAVRKVARARFLKSWKCHLPTTLLAPTASTNDRAMPRKPASQEIPRCVTSRLKDPPLTMPLTTPFNNERPETGPRRGTGQRPPFCVSCISSRLGHVIGLAALCLCAYFRDPCTVMHKRKIPAGARYPRNQNKSLLLRGNWLRSAKRPATSPPVGIREIREIHRATQPQRRPQASQGVRFFRGARPIRVYFRPLGAPCFQRSAHSNAQTQSRRHLLLPDNSNNKQPLIENWLPFAKAPAASTHCRRTYRAASP
jgi:hypothetical protein